MKAFAAAEVVERSSVIQSSSRLCINGSVVIDSANF